MSLIVARFAELWRDAPDRPLIHVPASARTLNATDICRAYERLAEQLRRASLQPGQLVVSDVGNRPESIVILLACRALDLALMAVEAGTPAAETRALAARFGARAILSPSQPGSSQSTVPVGLVEIELLSGESSQYAGAAVLKLTSGSAGLPKGVFTTESQLIADSTQIISGMRIQPEDMQIAVIPLSHSYGLSVLLMPVLLQGTAMVLRESFVPQQLPADAHHTGATRLAGVPFMFDYFVEHPPAEGWPERLTGVISAGARLSPDTAKAFHHAFGLKIQGFYGTTETGGICFDPSADIDVGDRVGAPLPGVTLSFVHDEDIPADAGRVRVQSPAVANGYVALEPGDFTADGFLTGDFGHLDAHGDLVLQGRISSFINVAGRKVHPDEVERVLRAMPGILDVRVVAAPDAKRGQQVVACIVPAHGIEAPHAVEVRQYCAAQLAPHKVPRFVITFDAIPLTARGKTDRVAIEQRVRAELTRPL